MLGFNETEVKLPQDIIDIIPQERVTGDVLRGRGPRRGGLEKLLKYWRPIMRKPGGFRRCLVILADHPDLYPLERICAWLHHETTGLWPNEGNHHSGGKAGRAVKRTIKKATRKRRGKSFALIPGVDFPIANLERRSQVKSVMTMPLDGTDAQIDYKSSRVDRIGKAIESVLLPGERGALKPRHILATSATPGGSGLPGPKAGPRPGSLVRRATGNTRGFRCPPGFERGGHFTDARLSTCGRQLFGIPGSGRATVREVATGANEEGREKVGLVYAEFKASIGGGTQRMPEAVGRPNPEKQAAQVAKVLDSMAKVQEVTSEPIRRLVRTDGSILQPLAPLDVIGKQKDNPDLKDASLLTRVNAPGAFGAEELALMQTGLSSIGFSLPGGGAVELKRNGGPMTPGNARAFGKAISTASKMSLSEMDYAALLRETAAKSGAVTFSVTVPGEENPTKLVRVTSNGESSQVPFWVYKTFLAEGAPGKGEGAPAYSMTGAAEKVLKEEPLSG